jgi:hypothetical protein
LIVSSWWMWILGIMWRTNKEQNRYLPIDDGISPNLSISIQFCTAFPLKKFAKLIFDYSVCLFVYICVSYLVFFLFTLLFYDFFTYENHLIAPNFSPSLLNSRLFKWLICICFLPRVLSSII